MNYVAAAATARRFISSPQKNPVTRSAPRWRARCARVKAGRSSSPASAGGRWRRRAFGARSPSTNFRSSASPHSAPPADDPAPDPRDRRPLIAARPDALVIIDSPDFTHRVARRVRARAPAIPILDYVSPSVWAWRPGRARAMRGYVDCVLAILPFEPAAHLRLGGPPCIYVGHPLTERLAELRPNAEEARRRRSDPPLVLVLPGSRSSEFRHLLPIFGEALVRVAARHGPLEPVLRPCRILLDACAKLSPAGRDAAHRRRAGGQMGRFRTARAALAASGTVTLELALAGVPTVAAYRVTLIEEMIANLVGLRARLSSVILANLVIGENIVPEFLQRDARRDGSPMRCCRFCPTRRSGRGRSRPSAGSIISWRSIRAERQAAAIVLDTARRGRRDLVAAADVNPLLTRSELGSDQTPSSMIKRAMT